MENEYIETTAATNTIPAPKKRKRKGEYSMDKKWSVGRTIMFVVLILYAASMIGVLVWAFLTSMKGDIEYIVDPVSLPKKWSLKNYPAAFKEIAANGTSFPVMFLNSLWLSVLPPTINLLTASMAAYVMAQYNFPGKGLIWGTMIVTMTLPIMGTGASVYRMYMRLGFYNSPLLMLTHVAGLGGNLFLISSFKGVSKSYSEAAMLDGAGHFRIFTTIMLPQIMGVLSALWVMSFIGSWNDYMTPIMYLPKYTPITTGLYIYQKRTSRELNVPMLFAGSMMVLVIPLTLFAIFQEKFMQISFGGGIKS